MSRAQGKTSAIALLVDDKSRTQGLFLATKGKQVRTPEVFRREKPQSVALSKYEAEIATPEADYSLRGSDRGLRILKSPGASFDHETWSQRKWFEQQKKYYWLSNHYTISNLDGLNQTVLRTYADQLRSKENNHKTLGE